MDAFVSKYRFKYEVILNFKNGIFLKLFFLLLIAVTVLSCSNTDFKKLIKNEKNLHVIGVKQFEKNTLVVLTDNKKWHNVIVHVLLNNDNKIINFSKNEFQRRQYFSTEIEPIYFDKRYIIHTIAISEFIIVDVLRNTIEKFDYKITYVASMILFNNHLYFTTEKTSKPIIRLNLKTKIRESFKFDSANSDFYVFNKKLFVKHYTTKQFYEIKDNIVDKVDYIVDEKYKKVCKWSDFGDDNNFEKYYKILGLKIP